MNFKAILASLLIVMISMSVAFASTNETATVSVPRNLTIAKGTIIKVRAVDTVSSQKAKQNEKVHFKVIEDIVIQDVIVVPANTDVEAVITKVKKAGPWDKDGEIEVAFSEVKTKDGHSIPVTGMLQLRGAKPNLLVKYSLVGLFIKGKEAVIRAGAEVNLQIKEDAIIPGENGNLKKSR